MREHLAKRARNLPNVAHLIKFRAFNQLVKCAARLPKCADWSNASYSTTTTCSFQSFVVCMLCEGTGKTLVAVMLTSRLLTLNPRHSVVFVVDRILLALQQTQVIKKELGHKLFDRYVMNSLTVTVTVIESLSICSFPVTA